MEFSGPQKNVVIIGVSPEAAELFSMLLKTGRFRIVKILNPESESIKGLARLPDLDLIINTDSDPRISSELKKLKLSSTDIMSGLSAQLLFCAGIEEFDGGDLGAYRAKILSSLHEVRRSVYLAKNKEELLKLVLSICLRSLTADAGSIMLVDPQKRWMTIEMAQGLESAIVTSTLQKLGKGIAGRVARTGKPILIRGNPGKELVDSSHSRSDLISAICSPLLIAGEVVGVININSKNPARVFDQSDLRHLKRLADFTADVIKTSKEYEMSAQSTFALQLLTRARDILNLAYPIDERLNLLLMKIANAFHGEICNYYWFDRESNTFFIEASSSFSLGVLQGKLIKLNDFFTGRVLRTGSSFCFHMQLAAGGKRKWYLAQPVKTGSDLTGLLFLHLVADRDDLDRERNVLERISVLLGQELARDRSIESARMKSVKYSALSEVIFDFARIHNVRQLAKTIVSNACLILEAESCVLSLYNENMHSFEVLEAFSLKSAKHLRLVQNLDKAIALKATSNGSIILISDLVKSGYVDERVPTRSVLSMCLRKKGRPMAAISLYDKNTLDLYDHRRFSEDDKEVFIKFCQQSAKALERFLMVDMHQQGT